MKPMPSLRRQHGWALILRERVTMTIPSLVHAGSVRDRHRPRLRVERVLHQLSERLARIRLRPCEPPDQLERVGGAEACGADVGAGGPAHGSRGCSASGCEAPASGRPSTAQMLLPYLPHARELRVV